MRYLSLPAVLLLTATSAHAQRTTSNAVTASEDAFGRAVGSERIGIYSPDDVRGFNPVEAGNARVEGLYFDQMSLPNNRLIDSSSIRVGYAAQAWPFPSPTGIVNLQLEKYEGKRVISGEIESDVDGNFGTTVQVKIPLKGDKLGFSAGHGFRRSRIPAFRYINFMGEAINLTWKPTDKAEFNLFWSHFSQAKIGGTPILYPAGDFTPPEVERRDYIGQDWAHGKANNYTLGTTAKFPIGKARLEMGLFRSIRADKQSVADLALGVESNGTVREERINVEQGLYAGSTSGEAKLIRVIADGMLQHRLTAMIRGRVQTRRYGGSDRYVYRDPLVPTRPVSIFNRFQVAEPTFNFGPKNESTVHQLTFGAAYELANNKGLRIGASAQKSDYRKSVDFGNPTAPDSQVRARPWLFTVNATVPFTDKLRAYGGFVQGLEESPNAPDIASNANEAPPAGRTKQIDFGLRYAITPHLTLITGAFQINKPYYNLDATRRYGVLGNIRNRGMEVSLAGRLAKGLTLVSGTLFLDPKLSGPEVTAGRIGQRPVGAIKRRSIVNLDWRPKETSPWSFDFSLESLSGAAGNAQNKFTAPPRETFGVGARYRFDLARGKWLARVQLINMFNDYGWRVLSSGGFQFNQPRTFVLTLSTDY